MIIIWANELVEKIHDERMALYGFSTNASEKWQHFNESVNAIIQSAPMQGRSFISLSVNSVYYITFIWLNTLYFIWNYKSSISHIKKIHFADLKADSEEKLRERVQSILHNIPGKVMSPSYALYMYPKLCDLRCISLAHPDHLKNLLNDKAPPKNIVIFVPTGDADLDLESSELLKYATEYPSEIVLVSGIDNGGKSFGNYIKNHRSFSMQVAFDEIVLDGSRVRLRTPTKDAYYKSISIQRAPPKFMRYFTAPCDVNMTKATAHASAYLMNRFLQILNKKPNTLNEVALYALEDSIKPPPQVFLDAALVRKYETDIKYITKTKHKSVDLIHAITPCKKFIGECVDALKDEKMLTKHEDLKNQIAKAKKFHSELALEKRLQSDDDCDEKKTAPESEDQIRKKNTIEQKNKEVFQLYEQIFSSCCKCVKECIQMLEDRNPCNDENSNAYDAFVLKKMRRDIH